MISYERGIIFLTYPLSTCVCLCASSSSVPRWSMKANLQQSWRVYMVEKVNYLLHSYTTCHDVFYSYDSLSLILFTSSPLARSLPSPIMSCVLTLALTFFPRFTIRLNAEIIRERKVLVRISSSTTSSASSRAECEQQRNESWVEGFE